MFTRSSKWMVRAMGKGEPLPADFSGPSTFGPGEDTIAPSLFFVMRHIPFDSFGGLRLNVKASAKMGSVSRQLFPVVKCTFIFNLWRKAIYDRRSLEKSSLRDGLLPYLNWLHPDK